MANRRSRTMSRGVSPATCIRKGASDATPRGALFALVLAALLAHAGAVSPSAATTSDTRIDPLPGGVFSYDFYHQMSADGRWVVYEANTFGFSSIQMYDRRTWAVIVASVNSSGASANDESYVPYINQDGRFIAFRSKATNLVTGDTNATTDAFVHDRVLSTTTRVSLDSAGTQANDYSAPLAISADGRYVVIYSSATNLVPGDTNGKADIFVRDRTLGTTELISVDSNENAADNHSLSSASISSDGRYVVFGSGATNLVAGDTNGVRDVFVRDRVAGTTARISVSSSGTQADGASGDAFGEPTPLISADGRYIAFTSAATNLVAGDTNDRRDLFVHDRVTGTIERASIGTDGTQSTFSINRFSMSADGRIVLFDTETPLAGGSYGGVYERDLVRGLTRRLAANSVDPPNETIWYAIALSGDARYAAVRKYEGFLTNQDRYIISECGGAVCGDGTTTLACETCDDANTADFDGCSSSCALEPCHTCGDSDPTVCTPHANGTACDDDNTCTPTQACSSGRCLGTDICLNTLCPGSPDPCVVSGNVALLAGGKVDLNGRALQITASANVTSTANGGTFALVNASQVTTEKKSKLVSSGSGVDAGAISIESSGACTLNGQILANGIFSRTEQQGGNGGAVSIDCAGITMMPGSSIQANGSQGRGGTIGLDAGSGVLTLTSASLMARGQGESGGRLELRGDSACDVKASVKVDATVLKLVDEGYTESFYGDGGAVAVTCGGDLHLIKGTKLTLGSKVSSEVQAGLLGLESSGGDVTIDKGTKVTNHGTDRSVEGSTMSVNAAGMCRLGGALLSKSVWTTAPSLQMACGDVVLEPTFNLASTSAGGMGGALLATSAGTCAVDGKAKLSATASGEDNYGAGGRVELDCAAGINIGATSSLDVSGKATGGLGGNISLTSATGNAAIAGKLIAKGKDQGGATAIEACDVTLTNQGKLFADAASGGTNSLVAHEALSVGGVVSAKGAVPGVNALSYRTTGSVVAPQLVTPATPATQNPGLVPCP